MRFVALGLGCALLAASVSACAERTDRGISEPWSVDPDAGVFQFTDAGADSAAGNPPGNDCVLTTQCVTDAEMTFGERSDTTGEEDTADATKFCTQCGNVACLAAVYDVFIERPDTTSGEDVDGAAAFCLAGGDHGCLVSEFEANSQRGDTTVEEDVADAAVTCK